METLLRSKSLNNIPQRKLQASLDNVDKQTAMSLESQTYYKIAINRYAESNIPFEYWTLKMDKNFAGDPRLKQKYDEYVTDFNKAYTEGTSVCFAGSHGRGKTLTTTCILKEGSKRGYSCLYTTLSDIVSVLTSANSDDKFLAKRELVLVDFLVIDEFDSRFMPSENAADLYARSLENIFRTRSQNKLPTLMCTNSPNIVECFTGSLKASLESLMQGYMEFFPVMGSDFRKNKS